MKPSLLSLAILISMLFGLCVPHTAAQISLSDLTFEYQDECGNPLLESSLWREVEGKVISVIDGNSIILLDKDHKRRRVTLVAVDASIAGDSARSFLSQLVLNRTVSVLVSPSQAPIQHACWRRSHVDETHQSRTVCSRRSPISRAYSSQRVRLHCLLLPHG